MKSFFDKTFWFGLLLTFLVATVLYWRVPEAGMPMLAGLLALAFGWRTIALVTAQRCAGAGQQEAAGERVLLEELRNLLRETASQFSVQFAATRHEIDRVQGLLHDAIEDLTASFQGMHLQTEEQRTLTLSVTAGIGEADSGMRFDQFVRDTSGVM